MVSSFSGQESHGYNSCQEYEAKSHTERVGRENTLVIVKVDEVLTEQALAIFHRCYATKVEQQTA